MSKFSDLGLSSAIIKAIEEKGYTEATPIQAGVIPVFLNTDKDIIGQAQTGTGKTAAFGLPLLDRIDKRKKHVQAIILTPTRELAIQIAEEIKSFAKAKEVNITLLYGGQHIGDEIRKLKSNPQIVVGTPGRVQDHLRKRTLILDKVDNFILDEADEMLNVGFREEIDTILESAPEKKRVLLFSATMPKAIKDIVHNYMGEHELISVKSKEVTNENIEQKCYKIAHHNKFEALCRVIETEENFYGIIFCRTKAAVDETASNLMGKGYLAEGIHGDVEQKGREKILARFKGKKINILVATDVAARGIDVSDLTHVVNYDLPDNPETYTHRIGRTGRAGKKGIALSFVSRRDLRTLVYIERIIKSKINVENVPKADEIIKAKKIRLIEKTTTLMKEDNKTYLDLAEKMLELGEAKEVLSAILRGAYGKVFDESNYREVNERSSSIGSGNQDGKTRLFIAKGRSEGFDVVGIKKLIEGETGLDLKGVRDVALFDNFSFMNINSDDAEIILATYKQLNRSRPLVVQAKERSNGGGGGRLGGYRGGGGGGYRGGSRGGGYRRDGERNNFRRDRGDKGKRW